MFETLKKTHTSLFHLALSYDPEFQQKLNKKRLPRVSQEYPVYAWYSGNKNSAWQTPVIDMSLWQKQLLGEAVVTIQNGSLADLKVSLDGWLTHANKLGLLFEIKKCT